MKKILLCAVLFLSASFTQAADLKPYSSMETTAPTIIGYIKNRANGLIVLTSTQVSCQNGKFFFYALSDGGKVVGGGCYTLIDDNIFATWNDDKSVYQYSGSAINFTQEWLDYSE
jgi:hypothetical protein